MKPWEVTTELQWRPPAGQGRPACRAAGLRTRGDGAVERAGNRNRSGQVRHLQLSVLVQRIHQIELEELWMKLKDAEGRLNSTDATLPPKVSTNNMYYNSRQNINKNSYYLLFFHSVFVNMNATWMIQIIRYRLI